MGFWQRICEFYDNCYDIKNFLPLYHKKASSEYEISITPDGEFIPGSFVEAKMEIVIPYSISSYNRSGSKVAPHPLFDFLSNIDVGCSTGAKTSTDTENSAPYIYRKNLSAWSNSSFSLPAIKAISKYHENHSAYSDIIKDVNDASFKLNPDALLRIRVCGLDGEEKPWADKSVIDSWINYYNSQVSGENDFCAITGTWGPKSIMAPKVLGNAKLISCEEKSFIRYTGDRFSCADEACAVSQLAIEKSDKALQWLRENNSIWLGQDVFYVAFSTKGTELPDFTREVEDDPFSEPCVDTETGEVLGINLRQALLGKLKNSVPDDNIVICGFERATAGRLSIIYYSEMGAKEFAEKLEKWSDYCCSYRLYNAKGEAVPYTPSLKDIAKLAYGLSEDNKSDKKQIYSLVQRLVPCVLNSQKIPDDIVSAIVRRCCKTSSMEHWERLKTTEVAAAVIRKHYNDKKRKEIYTMGLDRSCTDSSYLFGRLLAYLENIEGYALYKSGQKRQTTAERLMPVFSQKPVSTYKHLYENAIKYFKKVKNDTLVHKWKMEMHEIISLIPFDGIKNSPLSPSYILGYHAQMHEFECEKEKIKEMKSTEEENVEE